MNHNDPIPIQGPPLAVVPVLGVSYELRVSPVRTIDVDGRRCRGLVDYARRILWLDPSLREADRPRVTAALVAHAWQRVTAAPAPHEALPPAEMAALARDLLEAEWRLLAPPGWPMPKNLPAGAWLKPRTRNLKPTEGMPPHILSDDGYRVHCPHCGKAYRSNVNLQKLHLSRVHGWLPDAHGIPAPPDPADRQQGERRAA